MNILNIAKSVGLGLLKTAVPAAGPIIDVVNAYLSDDDKLNPDTATGADLEAAVGKLPPEQQAAVLSKQYDVQIATVQAESSAVVAMLQTEQASQHSTRPKIALGAFRVVAFVSVLFASVLAYAVLKGDGALVAAVSNAWPLALAIILPMVRWLDKYFGVLRSESRDRLAAITGQQPASRVDSISRFINNLRKPQ